MKNWVRDVRVVVRAVRRDEDWEPVVAVKKRARALIERVVWWMYDLRVTACVSRGSGYAFSSINVPADLAHTEINLRNQVKSSDLNVAGGPQCVTPFDGFKSEYTELSDTFNPDLTKDELVPPRVP